MVMVRSWVRWVGLFAWSSYISATMGALDYTPEALADQVDWSTLPGAENLAVKDRFNMFAGYIDIDSSNGRKIFYWFVEAQQNADDAPVILWTNGGPGCSGMLGLLTEHGPFQVRNGGNTLVDNPHSWNKLANMLYVEIPSGVGFSYSGTPSDYYTGDDRTAADNHGLVHGWLNRFPKYRSNDFHISSESYGGHYMPQLAENILKGNELSRASRSFPLTPIIRLVGFLVGNPYTDATSNEVAQYQAYWGHQLLPKPVYDKWLKDCVEGGYYKSFWSPEERSAADSSRSSRCDKLEESMDHLIGNVNPYALDFPVCTSGDANKGPRSPPSPLSLREGGLGRMEGATVARSQRAALKDHVRSAWEKQAKNNLGIDDDDDDDMFFEKRTNAPYEPCAEDFTTPYLNRADVQEALHVREGTVWEQCSSILRYRDQDMLKPMMPYYRRLLDKYNISILVFSGDDDAVCATEGTQWWIYNLGYDVDPDCFWEPWEQGGQVAGYETRFSGVRLSFVTVHSAGHEVPAYQPARALKLLSKYLDGSWWGDEKNETGSMSRAAALEMGSVSPAAVLEA